MATCDKCENFAFVQTSSKHYAQMLCIQHYIGLK